VRAAVGAQPVVAPPLGSGRAPQPPVTPAGTRA
jgi:hypothetical protein